jgi:hypothetical protein
METTQNSAEQFVSKTLGVFTLYADTNMKTLRQLMDFCANIGQESVSLAAELQASNFEALQAGQAYVLRRLNTLSEAPKNPAHYYQQGMTEFAAGSESVLKLFKSHAQALLRSSEQYWSAAQQTGSRMQEQYAQVADTMQSIYSAV